jgi:hypothetical protein
MPMPITTSLLVNIDIHPLYLQFSASHECLPHSISLELLFMVCIKCMFFGVLYLCLSATVLLWTVICLAIDVHLHGLLATSDLSESLSSLSANPRTNISSSSLYPIRYIRLQREPYYYAIAVRSSTLRR